MNQFKTISKNQTDKLPQETGVYAFFAEKKRFLYIGKAINLKQRVKSHWQQKSFKDAFFLEKTEQIGYRQTNSEIEALMLEAQLIKKHQPPYNTIWKDDKSYRFVAVSQEDWPRVYLTHQKNKTENAQYIGPFVDRAALQKTLRILRKVFPYRTCSNFPKRPCLYSNLNLCPAPCQLPVEQRKDYQRNIKNLIKVLQGRKSLVLQDIKKQMKEASKQKQYETAAKKRDQLNALSNILTNAHVLRQISERQTGNWQIIKKELAKLLAVDEVKRIEASDISNIQGQQATGSMVVFEKDQPAKDKYRKFKVKISGKANDTAMLKEILTRRLKRAEWPLPQIILIDGGVAQLRAGLNVKSKMLNVKTASQNLQLKKIRITALAKRKNELFIESKRKPVLLRDLPKEVGNLFLYLRDEAHRFAITYHKHLRSKSVFQR